MIILSRFDGSWLVRLIRNINDGLVYVWDGNFCSISFKSHFSKFFPENSRAIRGGWNFTG